MVLRPVLPCGSCDACLGGRTTLYPEGRLVGRDLTGGFAERFVVPKRAAVDIGRDLPDDIATSIEPLANAVHVTERAVQPGDNVLVLGAGPIGTLMARMSVERGAERVFITDRIPARLDLARAQGARPLPPETADDEIDGATDDRPAAVTGPLRARMVYPHRIG